MKTAFKDETIVYCPILKYTVKTITIIFFFGKKLTKMMQMDIQRIRSNLLNLNYIFPFCSDTDYAHFRQRTDVLRMNPNRQLVDDHIDSQFEAQNLFR